MRKCLVHIDKMECVMGASVTGELQVNYNNIHKVFRLLNISFIFHL